MPAAGFFAHRLGRAGAAIAATRLLELSLFLAVLGYGQPLRAQTDVAVAQAESAFNIPPQALDSALEAYARQTGIQILSDGPIDTNLPSPGVVGIRSKQAALSEILNGTGFTYSNIDPQAVTLSRLTSPRAGASPSEATATTAANGDLVLALPTLHVEAAPPPRDAYLLYGLLVKSKIAAQIERDAKIRRLRYSLDLDVELGETGAVTGVRLRKSTGDTGLDGKISELLVHQPMGSPPPPGMPQPIRVRIEVN